jgi:tetratricopeptide (TPR) repeat protein
MRASKLLLGLVVAAALGVGGWLGWRWYTTPVPPQVSLDGADPAVARAVEEAREEVRRQPRSGAAWGKLGMVLSANGYREPASSCFEEAERLDPADPRWPYLRGVYLLATDSAEAVRLMRRALALARSPEQRAAIHFRLALTLIRDDDLDEAGRQLKALAEIDRDGPRAQFGLGLLAAARDDRAAACEHLAPLTDVPFARKQASAILARVADKDGELARACEQRAAALPADLPWPDAVSDETDQYAVQRKRLLKEATELQQHGRLREARDLLRQLAAESPGALAHAELGFTLFQMNEWEEASEALRTAISFDPQNVKAHYFLGTALLLRGEKKSQEPGGREAAREFFRQAVAAEDRALAIKADHGYAHLARGRALKGLGRTDEALAALRQAVLCQPEYADMHLALGEALAEAGQVREGLVHLEDAARLAKPDDPRPRQALDKWRARAVKPSP